MTHAHSPELLSSSHTHLRILGADPLSYGGDMPPYSPPTLCSFLRVAWTYVLAQGALWLPISNGEASPGP